MYFIIRYCYFIFVIILLLFFFCCFCCFNWALIQAQEPFLQPKAQVRFFFIIPKDPNLPHERQARRKCMASSSPGAPSSSYEACKASSAHTRPVPISALKQMSQACLPRQLTHVMLDFSCLLPTPSLHGPKLAFPYTWPQASLDLQSHTSPSHSHVAHNPFCMKLHLQLPWSLA